MDARESSFPHQRISAAHLRRRGRSRWLSFARTGEADAGEVRCFGDQRIEEGNLKVIGYEVDTSNFTCPKPLRSVFGAVRRCTDFNTTNIDANLVHCHTWYSHFGGILAKKDYGIPLVITVHSLEPLRPWKREQL